MIVLGADTHKRSHAIAAGTGELLGERTVSRSAGAGSARCCNARRPTR
jgi:hypothetical protein